MPNKALHKEFEKGLPGALYYLWSDEPCFLEDALSRFVEIVIASGPMDFNYDVFDSTSGIQEIIDSASMLPFMASRRLVALKDFHLFSASRVKALLQYLTSPSESTCMLILSQKAPKESLKVKWQVYPLEIHERDMPFWLRRAAEKKGLRLTDDAIDCLFEYVGYDVGLLLMEIEKFTLSGTGTVTAKDVVSSTGIMREYTSFDLVDSLIAGQKTRSFRILKSMLGGNPYEATVILGTLNWHYKQFYSLWMNRGKRPFRMRDKTYRTLVKYLPSFHEDDFFHIFRNLHEADLGVKTSGRPELVLEVLLIKLLQTGAGN